MTLAVKIKKEKARTVKKMPPSSEIANWVVTEHQRLWSSKIGIPALLFYLASYLNCQMNDIRTFKVILPFFPF